MSFALVGYVLICAGFAVLPFAAENRPMFERAAGAAFTFCLLLGLGLFVRGVLG